MSSNCCSVALCFCLVLCQAHFVDLALPLSQRPAAPVTHVLGRPLLTDSPGHACLVQYVWHRHCRQPAGRRTCPNKDTSLSLRATRVVYLFTQVTWVAATRMVRRSSAWAGAQFRCGLLPNSTNQLCAGCPQPEGCKTGRFPGTPTATVAHTICLIDWA